MCFGIYLNCAKEYYILNFQANYAIVKTYSALAGVKY